MSIFCHLCPNNCDLYSEPSEKSGVVNSIVRIEYFLHYCNNVQSRFVLEYMRLEICLCIASIFAVFLTAYGRIDYSQHEKEALIYQKPLIEVERLANEGNVEAKLRLAVDKLSSSPSKAMLEMKTLYEDADNLTAGYYIANSFSAPEERKSLLEQISRKGNSYTSALAKCDLLIDDLKRALIAKDKKAFDDAYDALIAYAKEDFQPAAIKLAFFIDTHTQSLKGFIDTSAENIFLYKKLSEISKNGGGNYKVRYAQELAKSGKWEPALSELKPLVSDFMARKNFTMEESLMQSSGSNLYAQAKAAAITACAYENGLGVKKDAGKAKGFRDKIAQIRNPWWCKHFADSFEESYGRKNAFIFSSPIDAKTYRSLSTEFENNKTERLRQYNLSIAQKVEEAKKKSLEELKDATDEIGKVEYAKKLLGIKTLYTGRYTIGKYNNTNAKEAIGLLEKMAKEGSQYANLALAQLYWDGNSKNTTFERVNMPVDFDADKARAYASEAIRIGGENAWTANAYTILGDLDLFKTNAEKYSKIDGYTVKTTSVDSALSNYLVAAKLGNTAALDRLHDIYYRGIPVGYGKYLVEPNAMAAFAYAKDSVDLGDPQKAFNIAFSFYIGRGIKKDVPMAGKYIKTFLNSNCPWNNLMKELAAILIEKNELEGYKPEDVLAIRNSISKSSKVQILLYYDHHLFDSKTGREYWNNINDPKESVVVDTEFLNYFKLLPQTQDNRFLYSLCMYYNNSPYEESPYKKIAYDRLIDLAKEGYVNAIKFLAKSSPFLTIPGFFRDDYIKKLKELNLPIEYPSNKDELHYNIQLYEKTHDDSIVYNCSNYIWGDCLEERLNFLSKYSKNNEGFKEWLAYRLITTDAKKSPQEFDEIISSLKALSKDKIYSKDAYILLAYAYSGMGKTRKDISLSSEYLKLHRESQKGELSMPINVLQYSYPPRSKVLQDNLSSLNLFIAEHTNNRTLWRPNEFFKCTVEELRNMYKENQENNTIKTVLAEKEMEAKNYESAYKLYKELNDESPNNLNYTTPLAELYYYGLGVKENKPLAVKYYKRLFDKPIGLAARSIIQNSLGYSRYIDFCKVRIPKDIIIDNIKKLDIKELRNIGSLDLLSFLEKNKETALRDKIEEILIEAKDENAMAFAGRRFLNENTPEGDKKAFEMFSKMDEYGYELCSSELGVMYFSGRGTKQDYKKAFEIFSNHTRIYNSINAANCAWLALMYKMGLGVEKSEEMSNKYIDLIEKSCDPSYNLALYGDQLVFGSGYIVFDFNAAPKCPELGVEMIRRAANMEEPHINALLSYAIILEEGKYAKQDLKQAAEFYEKFARLRKQKAYNADEDYWGFSEAIRILKNSPDKADSAKAFSLAEEWLKLSPDSINAKIDMALLLMNGIGVEKDEKRAVEYLNEAIKSELKSIGYLWRAYGVLAYCYMEGIGVEKSPEKVREIISAVRKIKTSRCGVWHPFLTYAEWFNPNTEITDTCVVDNPTLPKSKEICLFWLDELEKVADTAKNPRFSVKAFNRLIKFFGEEKGFENPEKVEELKIKLDKAKIRAEEERKKYLKRK